MANKLYRKTHEGREFAQLETFNRATLRVVIVHQIDRQTVARAKWNEELAKAVEVENAAAECSA